MSERMTDLERAYAFMEGNIACQRSICSFMTSCGCAAEIADLIAAARQEGAEQASGEIRALRKALHDETMKRLASAAEMRERALEAARDGVRVAFGERRDQEFIGESDVIGSIEDAFASTLSLTPEGAP